MQVSPTSACLKSVMKRASRPDGPAHGHHRLKTTPGKDPLDFRAAGPAAVIVEVVAFVKGMSTKPQRRISFRALTLVPSVNDTLDLLSFCRWWPS